jgi:hypothetical protein
MRAASNMLRRMPIMMIPKRSSLVRQNETPGAKDCGIATTLPTSSPITIAIMM